MRPVRLELTRPRTLEPKSSASANSATGAFTREAFTVCSMESTVSGTKNKNGTQNKAPAGATHTFDGQPGRMSRVSNSENNNRQKIKVRWWHILLIAFFVVVFLGLAYWQWTRFQSGGGDFQNLGYAMQWPLFAGFVVYAYRSTLKYENERIDAETEAAEMGEENFQYQAKVKDEKLTKISEDFLPQRPKMDVEEFNRLADDRRRRGGMNHNEEN